MKHTSRQIVPAIFNIFLIPNAEPGATGLRFLCDKTRKERTLTAPDTNITTQSRRHRWPLIAIAAALIFGAVMFLTIFSDALAGNEAKSVDGPVMMNSGEDS